MYPAYYHIMSYICELGKLNINDKIYKTILSSHWRCKWVRYLDSYQILYNVANCYCNVGGFSQHYWIYAIHQGRNSCMSLSSGRIIMISVLHLTCDMKIQSWKKKHNFSIYRLHCGAINMLEHVNHQGYLTYHTIHRERHVRSAINIWSLE